MRIRSFVAGVVGAVVMAVVVLTGMPRVLAADVFMTSPVADAAERGDTEAVRKLVREGADVNAAQGDGMTALHWVALNGDLATMDVLLVAGANTESLTRVGRYTPLHLASSRGHGRIVARLVDAGSKPAAVTSTGVQPLHLAAQAGSAESITALLAKGADINARDTTHGRTALVFAASQNRLDAVKALIAKGADLKLTTKVIDYPQRQARDAAANSQRSRVVAAASGRTASAPAFFGDPPQTGAAVSAGAQAAAAQGAPATGRGARGAGGGGQDPFDPDTVPAGGFAFGRGARGGDPNAPRPISDIQQIGRQGGFTALHYAAREGFTDAALALVAAGTPVNHRSEGDLSSPMLVATINGHFDLAAELLARGADPNLPSDDGVAPLFAAINNDWALRTWYPQPTASKQQKLSLVEFMEVLLKAGADPNARVRSHIWYAAYNAGRMGIDFTGATPFWRAAYSLDVDAMRLLLRYGADPNIATLSFGSLRRPNDPSGLASVPAGGPHVPAFHAASGVGYGTSRVAGQHRYVPDGWIPAAKFFIEELGVDVNLRDADGFTALHHAAARGDNKTILYLISKGADVMVVNRAGQTTVDMANSPEQRTQPFPETIKLLEGLGAKNNHNCRACG